MKGEILEHVTGYEVYGWPEFTAFCHRLGIPILPDVDLKIVLTMDHVIVTQKYRGGDREKGSVVVDTDAPRGKHLDAAVPRRSVDLVVMDDPATPKEPMTDDEHARTLEWFKGVKKA